MSPIFFKKMNSCFLWVTSLAPLALTASLLAAGPTVAQSSTAPAGATPTFSREQEAFFEQKVRPLLADKCFSCHSVEAKKQKGGLLLDSRDAILKGGDSGPAATSAQVQESLLLRAVHYLEPDLQMPPKEKLGAREVAVLEQWIQGGLPFPAASSVAAARRKIDLTAGRQFWAFRPLSKTEPPVLKHDAKVPRRLDAYVLAKLQERGIAPAPEAPRAVLLRRAKFDLIGLPPSPEELASFEADISPDAFEKHIDTWLASPQYGERWARHWLDLVRYCDIGESWQESKGKSYPYRDWTIDALNQDVSYERFVTLQLAADLVPDARAADRPALGFIGLSPTYWKELQLPVEIIKTIVSDEYEERVHTLSSVFFGINLACARCHDHKFDPFTAEDYYGIAGVFASTRTAEQSLDKDVDGMRVADLHEQVSKLEAELKKLKAKKAEDLVGKIAEAEAKVSSLKADPQYNAMLVTGVREGSLKVEAAVGKHGSQIIYTDTPQDLALEVRGNPNRTGAIVERHLPAVFSPGGPVKFSSGSGRLDLAKALFSDARDLVARVIVNRIWTAHFGTGIVGTPSDFGMQGERPTHPELLDDLSARFIQAGWSLKWLHREIMLSSTYRQASGVPPSEDPELRFYSRFPRRRLEVEQWRDALLTATNSLDMRMGGPAIELSDATNMRRTVYGLVKRRELSDILRLHDFPDPITHAPVRLPTTTPLQQLFTLNSPLLREQSLALARRLTSESPDSTQRIAQAYVLLFGRRPTPKQTELGLAFVSEGSEIHWQEYLQVLMGSNEFLFID